MLTREGQRSVGPVWIVVGTCALDASDPDPWASFDVDNAGTRLAARALERAGWRVKGKAVRPWSEYGPIEMLESDGRITNPDSIRGKIRDRNPGSPTDKRTKVQKRFGTMGRANVAAMRAAINWRKK
jgi:hypothetical protein